MTRELIAVALAVGALLGAWADTWTDPDTGYTWTYRINGDIVEILDVVDSAEMSPVGAILVPPSLGGKTVTHIGKNAFWYYSGLTSVTIPGGVTSIGDCAFYGCSGLTSVTIPNSVTSIGRNAFEYCRGLTSVTIPDGVTSIEDYAFYDCSGLTSVTIGNGVTSIGDFAFDGCSGLTSVTIPNSVASIGGFAFVLCSGLTSVTIPDSVTHIGESAFDGTPFYDNQPDGLVVLGKVAYKMKGECPANVIIPVGVMSIGVDAFGYCRGLTNVTIPNSVTSIEVGAFSGCSGLTSMTIPNSVTSIGNHAFSGCSGLANMTIPDSVMSIGGSAFWACSRLTSVTIPDGIMDIGGDAFDGTPFYGNQPDGLVVLGKVAYKMKGACPANVIIPDSVMSIGGRAFYGCTNLTNVTIPNSVTSIGNYAFSGCSGLANMTIPASVTSIGSGAFLGCSGLTSVTIPNSVTSIGDFAFYGCSGLTSVTIPASVTSIEYNAFQGCSGLTSVTIPASVTSVGDFAFYSCSGLEKAYMPRTLEGQFSTTVFRDCAPNFEIEYYDVSPKYEFIVGMKKEVNFKLVGYTAKGLPSGLKYDARRGVVSGAAKAAGEYEATFTKKGEDDVTVVIVVREEKVSVGCAGLSGGAFVAGVAGNADGIPLEIESETDVKSVAVTKLPAGMKYDTKTGLIIGAPTKPGDYAVTVTVTTKSGAKRTETIAISVAALPDNVVGAFNGFVKTSDGEENLGTFQLTTTDAGKLTAKVTTAAGSYSFGGTCWDKVEGDIYSATFTTKKGETLTLALDSTAGWDKSQLAGTFAAVSSKPPYRVVAHKNAFGKTWCFNAEGNERDGWRLSYAENAKAAALTVTLNADGSTKIAGKLGFLNASGKTESISVSASGYADVTSLSEGVIIADFAPVVSVKEDKVTRKRVLSIGTNLWFDRSNNHPYIGSVYLQ